MICYAVSLCGCSSTTVFGPEHLYDDSSRDIIVTTTDGRRIEFQGGNYRVIKGNVGTISGTGRVIVNMDRGIYKDYRGTIGFSEIQNISTIEMTGGGKTMMSVSIVALPVIALLLYGMSQWHD